MNNSGGFASFDRDRMVRFLTIAHQSEHDGERLNAFSMACKMLDQSKLTFNDILHRPVQQQQRQQYQRYSPPPVDDTDHAEMFVDLLDGDLWLSASTRNFLESLREGFKKYGRLTEKQAAALERIHGEKVKK